MHFVGFCPLEGISDLPGGWIVVLTGAHGSVRLGRRNTEGVVRLADDRVMRGSRVQRLPRPNRTFSGGRVCGAGGCNTRLSIYNKWEFCWQHEPVHDYVPRGKRKRRSRAA